MPSKLLNVVAFSLSVAIPASAEVTRTVKAELSGAEASRFAIQNLIGTMRVTGASGETVRVVATVHAESEALADSLQFERSTTKKGLPLLRLRYPVEEQRHYRYPGLHGTTNLELGRDGDDWNWGFDRREITVSDRSGVLLYADVEIQLPAKRLDATFENRVGPISASGVSGKLWFDTSGGDVRLDRVSGEIDIDTGSGDVNASGIEGSLRCDTGSGACAVSGFRGDKLSLDTGSGNVTLRGVRAHRIDADTGSGNVEAEDVEMDSLIADTGSGDVRLRLPASMGFELRADLGGGEIENHIADATPVVKHREVIGYRRGDGRARIELDTGSGGVVLDTQN